MRHISVPKRLSHEYSSPSHEVLSNRSHSARPISPRTSPSPSRESLFRKSLSLQLISPRTIRSPSQVLSGGSARHPSSLTRRQKFDLDKSPSSFAFENEDLEDSQILREIEKERANYEIQKREEEMRKGFNKNDSDDEEEDSDDMSADASDLPEYSDMDCDEKEGGKKGFNAKDARKKHSHISHMSNDDDEDTSSDEEEGGKKGFSGENPRHKQYLISRTSNDDDEETSSDEEEESEEFIRELNKQKEENQIAKEEEQFRLIKIGIFGNKKDQDEEDTSDSDPDDNIQVACTTLAIESIPQPVDEDVFYKSLRDEVLLEEEQIKLDTNVHDIKTTHQQIKKTDAEKSQYVLESKNKQEEVDAIMRSIQNAGDIDTKVLRTKLTSASFKLEIARSHVTMAHETLLALKKQFGEYVMNLIDDFMDRASDWCHDIKACEYDCRNQLGTDIWITYGKSILATIQRRMIRHAIQEHYDDVDDVNQITPVSCNSHIIYSVTGYYDIMKEQKDYVCKVMHQCHVAKIDMGTQELLKIRINQFVRQTRNLEECEGRGFRNWLSANEGLMGTHRRLLNEYDNIQYDFCKINLRAAILKKYPHARISYD